MFLSREIRNPENKNVSIKKNLLSKEKSLEHSEVRRD